MGQIKFGTDGWRAIIAEALLRRLLGPSDRANALAELPGAVVDNLKPRSEA
jgi:hypothetical protein